MFKHLRQTYIKGAVIFEMSILLLFLLVGVTSSKQIHLHDNDAVLQPIATKSQARRICAELCMSGLGGEPCGDTCLDILPQGLPIQSNGGGGRGSGPDIGTRRDACPVLCANQLGYPLCQCDDNDFYLSGSSDHFKVDYVQICGYFCVNYNYKIYGCQSCNIYKDVATKGNRTDYFDVTKKVSIREEIDWNEWCKQMCSVGDGGAACNCDILPLMAPIK